MTAADRVAAALGSFAAGVAAWVLLRHGWQVAAGVAIASGVLAVGWQVTAWSRRRPGKLECLADGRLQWRCAGQAPVGATMGGQTRLLGPSVFLDLRLGESRRARSLRWWLTPLDVPRDVLRRWTVLLPRCGRAACS